MQIEGLIKDLTCWGTEKEHKDITQMLDHSIKSMRNIIDELSEITKIEDDYKEDIETVDIYNILKEVEFTIKDEIYKSNARLNVDLKVEEIKFSRKNLRSILYNLLSNAVKYKSPDRDPEVFIKTENQNGFVRILVKDNGPGIAEDKRDLIFSQFTRVEKNVDGTGIGLYLLKKIVDNEGGKIVVNSKIGMGSEFNVYLKSKE